MKKKIIGFMLVLCAVMSFAICANAAKIVDSGECGKNGDNVTWTLNDAANSNATDTINECINFDLTLLQEGGLSTTYLIDENDTCSMDIQSALYNRKECIVVRVPKLSCEDIVKKYENVINNSPELYYVIGKVQIQKKDNDEYIIYPQYKESDNAISLFSTDKVAEAVNEILSQIDNNMSDIEKIFAVHEYICMHYDYDYTYSIYDAEGFFENKRGVCQAQSLAFEYIMNKLKIPCITVSSFEMNHAWNMVKVNGNWYHIDITWDNSESYGEIWRSDFMVSDDKISNSHYGWDSPYAATDSTYESDFWQDISWRPLEYYKGYWYEAVCGGETAGIYKYSFKDNTSTRILEVNGFWQISIYNDYMYLMTDMSSYGLYMVPMDNLSETAILQVGCFSFLGDYEKMGSWNEEYETMCEKLNGWFMEDGYLKYALTDEEFYLRTDGIDGPQAIYNNYYKFRTFYSINLTDYKYKSNKCGDNLSWNIDDGGTLKITGHGKMWDWDEYNDIWSSLPVVGLAPWYDYADEIKAVSISDGIENIGEFAFYKCNNIMSVVTGDGLVSIGFQSFCECENLNNVILPNTLRVVDWWAFDDGGRLKNVYYGGTEEQWNDISIDDCNTNLTNAEMHYESEGISTKIISASMSKTQNGYLINTSFNALPYNSDLITVAYDGNDKIVALNTKRITILEQAATSIVDINDDICTVKIFIWSSLDGIKPLCESKEIKLTEEES